MQFPHTPVDLQGKSRSDRIMAKIKSECIAGLFASLGPSPEGVLQAPYSAFNKLSPSVLKIMEPLIEEIERITQAITYYDFVEAMENLLVTLTPNQKNSLFFPRKEVEREKCYDSPACVPRSKGVYERNTEKRASSQQKLVIHRERRNTEELTGCTFTPETARYKRPINWNK